MAKIRYTGPTDKANYDVAEETGGSAQLEPGEVYDVSDELAARLVASGGGWELVKPEKAKREATADA